VAAINTAAKAQRTIRFALIEPPPFLKHNLPRYARGWLLNRYDFLDEVCNHSIFVDARSKVRLGANPLKYRPSGRAASRRLGCAVRLGLSGAMITEYPLEHRRYDQSEYEPFWAAAAALGLHTAARRQSKIRGTGDKTLRDASSRATKAFYPALSLCVLIFSRSSSVIPPQIGHRRVSAGPKRF
jgi:hypothetical protein